MTSVSIRDLTLKFGSLEVLKSLNLDIDEGEFLVLLGPSGCGKSTLLNCIAGLLDISDGQIFIGGNNVTYTDWRRDNFYRAVQQLTKGAKRVGIEFDHVSFDYRQMIADAA